MLLVVPVLLIVQLGLGIGIFKTARHAVTIERNNNRIDMYVRANSKYISYAENATRNYQLTGDTKYLELYQIALDELKKNENYYDTLPDEIKRSDLKPIQQLSRHRLSVATQLMELCQNNAKDSALALGNSTYTQALIDNARAKTTDYRNQLSNESAVLRAKVFQLIYAFIIVIVSLILISLVFAWFIYKTFNQYTTRLENSVASLEDTNQKMTKLNEGFMAANSYLEQLAYISAHDIKSPIHTLGGLVDLLIKSENISPAGREIMRLQKKAVLQMQQTNNGLNDILKLRQGLLSKEAILLNPQPLGQIVTAVKETLQLDIDKSGAQINIQLNGLEFIPFPFVYMQSMFYNLIANAIKFRSPDRPLVINVEAKKLNDNNFRFSVADNGLGFDILRSKTKLFGIFKRFHPQIEGTGVGLHIVKSIAEAFGGEITANSEPGKGTEFVVILNNPITS